MVGRRNARRVRGKNAKYLHKKWNLFDLFLFNSRVFSLSVFWTSNANKAKLQGQFQSTLEIASHFPSPPLLTGSKLNLDTCICSIHPHKIVQSNLKYAETAVIDQFEHFICCFRQNGEYCLNFSNGSFLSFSFLFFVKINNKILKKIDKFYKKCGKRQRQI